MSRETNQSRSKERPGKRSKGSRESRSGKMTLLEWILKQNNTPGWRTGASSGERHPQITQEAIEAAEAGLKDGSLQVFAGPLHRESYNPDGSEKDVLDLAEGEAFAESDVAGGKTSAPYFDYIVDGITVVSDQ